MHSYAPDDEEPHGTLQWLLARCLPQLRAQRQTLRHQGFPGLFPLAIAHRIAQHQHQVDVLPTPTHTSTFEACFAVDQEVGRADSLTHLVLGVLRLVFIAAYVSQTRSNASLIGQVGRTLVTPRLCG